MASDGIKAIYNSFSGYFQSNDDARRFAPSQSSDPYGDLQRSDLRLPLLGG